MLHIYAWSLVPSVPVTLNVFLFVTVHRYGNSKEHMTVAELKMFLETEQEVCNGNCIDLHSARLHNEYLLTIILYPVLLSHWMLLQL